VRPRTKKRKPLAPLARPLRRSLWLPPELLREIVAQAKLEERKPSDMMRILMQRGLRTTRGLPRPSEPEG